MGRWQLTPFVVWSFRSLFRLPLDRQARTIAATLGPSDRGRLDLLLTSIREAEQRLQQDQSWVSKPRPKVPAKPPTDDHLEDLRKLDRERQWFDLVHLALQ